jgi:DNA-binding SARP family transcriptional activator
MSPRLALYFLGPPQLYLDDGPIATERRKAVALLAYLAIERGQPRRELLSALLWPDYDQSKAYTNLRHTVWEIQQSIGEGWLIADRERIGLNGDKDLWLDVQQFESLLTQSRTQKDPSLRISLLTESTKLYRDHFLTGFTLKDAPNFNEWAFTESENLRSQLAGALTKLSEGYCALDQAEKAIPCARRLITLDPLNESAHRQLMEVYLQAGQQSAALRQYQICEEILRKELNLDPQPETYALYKQIRKGENRAAPVEKRKETAALKQKPPAQLPISIGSERESEKIKIKDKLEHDPAADLYVPDVWLRWMLMAAEETVGKLGLRVVLRNIGLEHLIGNYPPYEQPKPSKKFTFGEYATLNAGLIDFCGQEGESQVRAMGRLSAKNSVVEQGAFYGIATVHFPKFISLPAQLKMSMEVILEAVRKPSLSIRQDHRISLEDRGEKLAYIVQDCVFCAGKESNRPMCMYLTGNLEGALHWLTGETIHVEEVECRAMDAKACVWEIDKRPLSSPE